MKEAEPPLPGGPQWLMYLVPLLFPAGFFGAFALGRLLPGLPGGALAAFAILLPMAAVAAYAVRHRAKARRTAGLVPAEGGYSAKLLLLAAKLRERAGAIDGARRFSREVQAEPELESLARELQRTAREIDARGLAAFLTPEHFVGGSTEGVGRADWPGRAGRLREAATEVEAYANEVRARGGVFRGKPQEVAGCAIVLFAMAGGGAWLAFNAEGWFRWGVALVLAAVFLGWALVGSQTDAA